MKALLSRYNLLLIYSVAEGKGLGLALNGVGRDIIIIISFRATELLLISLRTARLNWPGSKDLDELQYIASFSFLILR